MREPVSRRANPENGLTLAAPMPLHRRRKTFPQVPTVVAGRFSTAIREHFASPRLNQAENKLGGLTNHSVVRWKIELV
jgi:hypothetical protein